MSDLHMLRRSERLSIVEVGMDSRPPEKWEHEEEIDTVVLRLAERNGNGKQHTVTIDLDSPLGKVVRAAFFADPAA